MLAFLSLQLDSNVFANQYIFSFARCRPIFEDKTTSGHKRAVHLNFQVQKTALCAFLTEVVFVVRSQEISGHLDSGLGAGSSRLGGRGVLVGWWDAWESFHPADILVTNYQSDMSLGWSAH